MWASHWLPALASARTPPARSPVPRRYDEEHRLKMTYEQVIKRLKSEQLGFPAEVKTLEATLSQKEADYEQLLMMSHDANQSKELAKGELSKFE